jgi:protein-S-isoprenylcysteine O-methyltransferase Ste14
MNPSLLFTMVILQIAAFQYGATLLVRTGLELPGGRTENHPDLRERLARMRRTAGRAQAILGATLAAAALIVAFALPLDTGPRKIALGVISLCSTFGLVAGYAFAYRTILRFAEELPPAAVRSEGLLPRTLTGYYSPAWEILPWGLGAATLAATVLLAGRTGAEAGLSDATTWIVPGAQIVLNVLLFLLTLIRVRTPLCPSPLDRKTTDDPEGLVIAEERIRRLEVRDSLRSRVGLILLLAVMQLDRLKVIGWGKTAQWAIVVALLALFVAHLLRLSRGRRGLASPAPVGSTPENGSGLN